MSTSPKTVAEIRNSFLDFFVEKGHTIVPSSPLVPFNDPTLMFTNSGMVQFKDVFLGVDRRPYVRAVSVQTCLRAGGKHNDLENVGYTARHHTFFEMLGNWSFGDYFKRESLLWGWELLTRVYGLPADKLWATVYIDDNEAYDIWTKEIGLPAERVIRIGDNKGKKYASDNFWMMADTGPCGPCSEIFYDHGPEVAGGPPGSPNEDGDRFIEIWNHVFMQFDMQPDGSLVKLPKPCVDTGMGLERLAAVLQHVHSNYEIDLFAHLISAAAKVTDCQDLQNKSLYVIADHIRAATFLVTDGVTPSNEGRGYVQRRIIRRAIRHGYKLGKRAPFFHHLVAAVVKEMGEAYPKLIEQQAHITTVLRVEEERFFETLATGMEILENNLTSGQQLAGEVAFKLHDTFGFPLDLSADVCREAGVAIDMDGFNACMQEQKNKARAAGKFKMDRALEYTGQATLFVGYDMLSTPAYITALYLNGKPVNELKMGEPGVVVLSSTPFYAESGGQIGDAGLIHAEAACFEVQDTQKIKADVFGHHGTLTNGMLRVGDAVTAAVNEANRRAIMRNHSATHLLHQALRDILGKQVEQKGSLVSAERTRFDFVHNRGVSNAEILLIEQQVNEAILRNAATKAKVMSIDDAKKTGAMMLFGEKYGEEVRVLEIDASQELCGGTHVARTGDIGLFKIISESGVAAGVRRIEGVTGLNSLHFVQKMDDLVANVAGKLRTSRVEVSERVSDALSQIKKLEKELQDAQLASARTAASALTFEPVGTAKNKLLLASLKVPPMDANALREAAGSALSDKQRAVVVLACVQDEKVQMVVRVTPDLTHQIKAGELVNFVAIQVGGKGGGKPDMAMAGGTNASQLNTALASVLAWVKQKIEP